MVLEGIYLEDQHKDTLLYADELRVNLGILSLANKTITVNLVSLENAVVNLNKAKGDTAFNFAFIPAAFQSDTTVQKDTTASPWSFDLEEVDLQNVRFTFVDANQGNDVRLALKELNIDLQTLGLDKQYPKINSINIDGLTASVVQPQKEADTLAQAAAQTAQLDTIAVAAKKAATDTLQNEVASTKEDSVSTPFNTSGYRLLVDEINIRNTNLKYDVKGMKPLAQGIDFNHIDVGNLLLEIADVEVGANTFTLDLNNFALQEKSGFRLDQLALEFKADMPQIYVDLDEFRTPHSVLDNGLFVHISSIADVKNLLQHLECNATFEDDYIAMQDIAYFTNAVNAYPSLQGQKLYLNGRVDADGADMTLENFTARINDRNYLVINGTAKEVTNLSRMYVDASVTSLETSTDFIGGFVPKGTLPPEFYKAGVITLKADVKGQLKKLTGFTDLRTSAGRVGVDFVLGTDTTFKHNSFDANIDVDKVDLARFLGKATGLGEVTLTGKVRGSQNGSDLAVQEGLVNLQRFQYKGYAYRNIQLKGYYLKNIAHALVTAKDPNLNLSLKAVANMQGKQPKFNVLADLNEVDLWALHLMADTLALRTGIQANITGTNPDAIVGSIRLLNLEVRRPQRTVKLDSMALVLDKQQGIRTIDLQSEVLNARAEGKFTFQELPLAINLLIKEYISSYPVDKVKLKQDQEIRFGLTVAQNPKLLETLVPGLRITKPISVRGEFKSSNQQMALEAKVPQAGFGVQRVDNFELAVYTTAENLKVNAQAAQVRVTDSLSIPKPLIAMSMDEDNLNFNLRLAAEEAASRLNLNGRMLLQKDTFVVSFEPSQIVYKKQEWTLRDGSKIVYGPKYLFVDNFSLQQGGQQIAVNGRSSSTLDVALNNISIQDMLELLGPQGYTLNGIINGKAQLTGLFTVPVVQAEVKVDSFKVNDNTIGNIAILADRQNNGWIGVNATVLGLDNDIRLQGKYNPADSVDNVNMDLTIAKVKLEQFNPFTKAFVNMTGNLNADMHLRGSPTDPVLTGQLVFAGPTALRPTMLGEPFTLTNQKILFQQGVVVFNKFTLLDEEKRTAVLDGTVNYSDLEKIIVDISFRTDGFQFMDSKYGDSETFYGKAFMAANVQVRGPVSNLVMDGRLKTLEGTELNLPVYKTGGAEVTRASYISFVDPNAPPTVVGNKKDTKTEEGVALSGFSLNARVSVTSDAKVNILIDPKNDDRISAAGDGDFTIRMTPQGDLLVNGVYTIAEGSYSMNLFGAVKKKFDVQKGSTITINGLPTDAKLNITAVYAVETNLLDLVGSEQESLTQAQVSKYREEIPVNVLMRIKGDMEKLDISFNIDIPQAANDPSSPVSTRLAELEQNENELNQQVFSLIVLNRFMQSNNPFASSGGGSPNATVNEGINNSLSQLLTQQINNLSEDYLGVQVNLDLESQDKNADPSDIANRSVGLSLTKNLINDRLSITVGSNIPLNGASGNTSSGSSSGTMIGDFTVAYKLTPNGSTTIRFFRRNEQTLATTTTTDKIGASLAFSKSFNKLNQMFVNRNNRKKKLLKQRKSAPNTEQNPPPQGEGDIK